MSTAQQPDVVLGTAGHIDHGKSSLVLALTGVDPDRLAEEKQRGITIELGFARLELPGGVAMGVVDVPGHERFVRQMIAGATGIDLALLCVAADDGIMPQTIEHLAVLELLGISSMVVALTKTDLVDDEWTAFMADEVRTRLSSTPYADAPIIGVSSRTGAGLDTLKAELARAARGVSRAKAGTCLRLPVDRTFTIKGAGTVVTGTLWSGTVTPGDEVEILPGGLRTRIRGVQVHGKTVERAGAGHRVALNVNALSTTDVRPGDFVVTPGSVHATDRFDADLSYVGAPGREGKPLESGTRVHIAHGTREVTGRVLLMGGRTSLAPGEHDLAQLRLDEPLPVLWRDRFVIRSFSPVHVTGGGVVLRAHPRRTTTLTSQGRALLDALRTGDEPAVARAAFDLATLPITVDEVVALSGLEKQTATRELYALVDAHAAVCLQSTPARFASKQTLQKQRSAIENALLTFHAQHPDATGIAKEALRQRCLPRADAGCFDALLAYATDQGVAVVSGGEVSHPKAGAGARVREEQAAADLLARLTQAAGAPPTIAELIASAGLDTTLGHKALGALEKQGCIRRVSKDFYFSIAALQSFEDAVRKRLQTGPAPASDLKDAMGTSRKYAIPLLEYFDANALTRREGDVRVLCK